MAINNIQPSGVERTMGDEDIIVSKTDLKGRILYVNRVFTDISLFTTPELLGQPHSIIRHPDMPRCIFKLMWDTIQAGGEIFAYVKNMCKNGDHYWVLAHVTPNFDSNGGICGFHSNRRKPGHSALRTIKTLYADLLDQERSNPDRKRGMIDSSEMLQAMLQEKGVEYDEFIFSV